MSYCVQNIEPELDSDSDDGRLASLDALRFALGTAPFFRRVHNIQRFDSLTSDKCDEEPKKCAVLVSNVSFVYGEELILNRINVRVPKGKIYALIGSGSSGKTTLLKCIIGRLRPKSGRIQVFGTNTIEKPVPGIGIGFMPQMIALYEELTIDETLQYYGYLYQVPMALIYQRVNFLLSLFNLPDENQLIRNLSDNHKWRISLAVSLIHSPPLLILDEPTVNVDPLIRHSIWDHLNSLCKEEGLTVIISTHYIEEVVGAHTIGLMRNGRLMAEDKPQNLLLRFSAHTFNELYSKLCQIDEDFPQTNIEFNCDENDFKLSLPMAEWPLCERRLSAIDSQLINFNFIRFFASFKKNLFVMRGNPVLMLFFFLFPSIQMIFFSLSIGQQVRHIPIAVFNGDITGELSHQLFRSLDNNLMKQQKYSTQESSIEAVIRGHVWAAITLSKNFSQAIELRYNSWENISSQEISENNIKLYIDLSNAVIGQQFIYSFIKSVKNFLLSMSDNYLAKHSTPIVVKQIIYGSESPTFMEFLAPGYVISIIFISPMALTAYFLIKDQMNGLLERCLSTGTSGLEVLLSHFITQMKVLVLQELLVLTVTFFIFGIPIRGPVMLLLLMVYLQGVVGISLGLLISAICPNAISAILLTSGTVIPGVFLSGITWPIESMPRPLMIVSKVLPLTLPIEAMRCIISREVTVSYFKVLIAFVISSLYFIVNTISAIIIFKWRTSS